jgi:hypothetical protein
MLAGVNIALRQRGFSLFLGARLRLAAWGKGDSNPSQYVSPWMLGKLAGMWIVPGEIARTAKKYATASRRPGAARCTTPRARLGVMP